ncbi:hypothetical protein [Lysinibacillus sp. G01H]|uniref:hypothetical protein n=1 Tax=Lysinibacillus sp. G01H TaxID=3026425 RepID=UPI00237E5BDF|nr:hypothetical protein [Lysinibacillus sp. G01H]WDU80019.1 hypothetical protein PSR12_02425 [Lysinibacillus sp. G01H]
MGRREKIIYPAISIFIVFSMIYFQITPKDITNLDNVLLGTITLASIGIGFLVAAVSMLSTLESNKFFMKLTSLGTDIKLLKILTITIRLLLAISIFSLVLLLITSIEELKILKDIIFYCWVGLLIYSLLLIDVVVKIFLDVVNTVKSEQ